MLVNICSHSQKMFEPFQTKDSEEPTTKDSEVQEEKEIGKSIVCAMECIIKSYSTNPVLS